MLTHQLAGGPLFHTLAPCRPTQMLARLISKPLQGVPSHGYPYITPRIHEEGMEWGPYLADEELLLSSRLVVTMALFSIIL